MVSVGLAVRRGPPGRPGPGTPGVRERNEGVDVDLGRIAQRPPRVRVEQGPGCHVAVFVDLDTLPVPDQRGVPDVAVAVGLLPTVAQCANSSREYPAMVEVGATASRFSIASASSAEGGDGAPAAVARPVAEPAGVFEPPHGGGIGVGSRCPGVRGLFARGSPLEGAVLGLTAGDPVFAGAVGQEEALVSRRGQKANGSLVLGPRVPEGFSATFRPCSPAPSSKRSRR